MTRPLPLPLHTQFTGIAGVRAALVARQVSAVELARSALDAIAADSDLNAFLHVAPDLTLAQAEAADQRLAAGDAKDLRAAILRLRSRHA